MDQRQRLLLKREANETELNNLRFRYDDYYREYLLEQFMGDDHQAKPLSETEWHTRRDALVQELRAIDRERKRLGVSQND